MIGAGVTAGRVSGAVVAAERTTAQDAGGFSIRPATVLSVRSG